MALIKCPNCGNQISDKASQCVKCGCPVKPDSGKKQTPPIIVVNANKEAICPKCGSTSIQTINDSCCGCSGSTHLNRCLNCGKKWNPKSGICSLSLTELWNCHKIPERCFKLYGKPMGICARCLGVFIGLFVSIGLLLTNVILPVIISAFFVLMILLDWGLQNYFGILSTNIRRFSTGLLGGVGATSLLFYCIKIM